MSVELGSMNAFARRGVGVHQRLALGITPERRRIVKQRIRRQYRCLHFRKISTISTLATYLYRAQYVEY